MSMEFLFIGIAGHVLIRGLWWADNMEQVVIGV